MRKGTSCRLDRPSRGGSDREWVYFLWTQKVEGARSGNAAIIKVRAQASEVMPEGSDRRP